MKRPPASMLFVLVMLLGSSFDAATSGVSEVPAVARQFSYDAAETTNKRKAPAVKHGAEDLLLDPAKRAKVTANARDIQRNFAIAAWMIRKHLDYVSTFDFQARTDDEGLNEAIEALWADWSRPNDCDVASRHPLDKMLRLAEARRTVDGDVGLMKLAAGELQAIEGDRVRNPIGSGPFAPQRSGSGVRWVHGVKVNDAGRALAYAVHRRTGIQSYEFERTVPAHSMCWFGYYDRFDQVRGISPIVAALNPLRDTYDALQFALVKAKVAQLFALAFFRTADTSTGELSGGTDAEGNEDKSGYQVDFGMGPIQLDLEPGDRAEFLESKSPSTEFQAFTQVAIAIALKSLDLPYSFFDESFTNFFGSRAAWMHYRRACEDKWNDARELRRKITVWKFTQWVIEGRLPLRKSQTINDLPFLHVPRGMPFWDPSKEIAGHIQAIKGCLDNPQRICREIGVDFHENVRQRAAAEKYARDNGVTLEFALQPAAPVNVVEVEDA